jgi:hypothetical protein
MDTKNISFTTKEYSGKISYIPSISYSGADSISASNGYTYGTSLGHSISVALGIGAFAYKLGSQFTLKGMPKSYFTEIPGLGAAFKAGVVDYTLGTSGNITGSDNSLGKASAQFYTDAFVIGNRAISGKAPKAYVSKIADAAAASALASSLATELMQIKIDQDYDASVKAKADLDALIDGTYSLVAANLCSAPALVSEALLFGGGLYYDKVWSPLLQNAVIVEPTFTVAEAGITVVGGTTGSAILAAGPGIPGVPAVAGNPNGVPPIPDVAAEPTGYGTYVVNVTPTGIIIDATGIPARTGVAVPGITIKGPSLTLVMDATGLHVSTAAKQVFHIDPLGNVAITGIVTITGELRVDGPFGVNGNGTFMGEITANDVIFGS